ncbi:acyltransferase [Caballeronia glebae]|uniref:acyltransferase n=1 Tax=Caballeronia glebae TaxID=1777143 RepID=UPI0038B82264
MTIAWRTAAHSLATRHEVIKDNPRVASHHTKMKTQPLDAEMNLPRVGRPRDESLDFIKFVAITLVIMVHLSAGAAATFIDLGTPWLAAITYRGITIICVPLFFMVTGVLLLEREHTVASIASRAWRLIMPLILWSAIYLSWYKYIGHEDTGNWVVRILHGPVEHLWFIYAIIGIYIFLPVASLFYIHSTTAQKLWIIGAWFFGVSVIPMLRGLMGTPVFGIDLTYVPLYSGYMLVGATLYQRLKNVTQTRSLMIGSATVTIATLTMAIYGTWTVSVQAHAYTMRFFDWWTPTAVIATVTSFVALALAYRRPKPSWMRCFVNAVASRTLGIYLLHMIIIRLPQVFPFSPSLGPWTWYPVACVVVLMMSLITVMIGERIPVVRILFPK